MEFERPLTLKDVQEIAIIPPNTGRSREAKMKLVTWYADSWLPACAGTEHFSPLVCQFKRATAAAQVPGGHKVALVPIASEAFGLVVIENCEEKFKHSMLALAKDINWKMPKNLKSDPAARKYHATKWSDSTDKVQS